jgi:hypothetical protein
VQEKIIISASRRTDIPASYSTWFMNRIKAGYCTTINPFNPAQISRVSLKPEDVRAFVFWTRNPEPLINFLPDLDKKGFKYYFLYTIIGYPRVIDPGCPSLEKAVEIFQRLSKLIGKEKVIWRYDPLLLSNLTPSEWHIQQTHRLIKDLAGYTERLLLSVVTPYRKTVSRMKAEPGGNFNLEENAFEVNSYQEIFQHLGREARLAGITPQSCAETADLSMFGIEHAKCIDDELLTRITGEPVIYKKDPGQRKACRCVVSKDIGVTNTCLFGCPYCYATRNLETAKKNFKNHNPNSPSLLDWHEADC